VKRTRHRFHLLVLAALCLLVPRAWAAVDHFGIYATGGSGTDPVATQTAGQSFTIRIVAYADAGTTVDTSFTGTVTLVSNASITSGATTLAFTAGELASHTLTLSQADTNRTISVSGSPTGASNTFTVVHGPPAVFTISGTGTQTAGAAQTLTLTTFDAFGNAALGYAGAQSVTFSGATASPAGDDPTATNSSSTAIGFGTSTSLTFTAGVATTSVVLYRDENASLSASATGVTTPAPLAVDVAPAGATTFTLAGSPTQTAGTAQVVTVTALDAFGNPAPAYTGAQAVTFSGATASPAGDDPTATSSSSAAIDFGIATSLTFTAGAATTSIVLYRDENASLSAAAAGMTTSSPLAVDVAPAAAAGLTASGFTDPTVAGVAHDLMVRALDAFGNTATGYAGTVRVTSSDAAAVLPADATLTAGVRLFSVQLRTAGTPQSLTATDTVTPALTATQSGINVSPAAANRLFISAMPTAATADVLFSPQPVIHIHDSFGNLVDDDSTTVTASLSSGTGGQFKGTKTVTAVNGVATFTNLAHSRKEDIVIVFNSSPSLTSASSAVIPVGSGTAAKFQVSGFPASEVAGTPGTVTVTVQDASDNTVTNYTGTIQFTSSDAQAILPANYTFLLTDNGVKTFTNAVQLRTVGTHSITAANTITGSQSGITVTPSTAVQLVFTTQPGSATAGSAFATQPVVRTRDAYGNNSTVGLAATVTVGMSLSSGSGTLAGTTSLNVGTSSATPGIATFTTLRIDDATGGKILTASATLDGSSATVSSSSFNVQPDAANHLAIQTQPPASVVAGTTFTPSPVVVIRDQFNNVRSGDTLSITATRSGGLGTLQGTTSVNAVAGVATFNALSHPVANDITVQFTSGSLLPVTSSTVTVTPGPAAALKISGSGSQAAGSANAITVTAIDGLGNTATSYAGSVSLTFGGANSSANPVTAPTVENASAAAVAFGSPTVLNFATGVASTNLRLYRVEAATVTASDGTLMAAGANDLEVTVTAATASRLVITGPSTLTAGAIGNLTITATDPYGNTATSYINTHSLTFSGAASSTNPVTAPTVDNNAGTPIAFGTSTPLSFTAGVAAVNAVPGNGRMRLYRAESALIGATDGSISAAGTDRLSVSVDHATANKLVVSGSASQTAGQTQDITVTIQDQYGNAATSQNSAVDVTFAGSGPGGGFNQTDNRPRVSQRITGVEADFGSATSLQFLAGVAGIAADPLQCRMRLVRAGTASITATASGLVADTPLVVVVNAGPPTSLGIAAVGTTSPTAGQATTVDVVLRDDGGNTVVGSTAVDLILSATPTGGSLRAGYSGAQIAAGASGTTITGVILDRAEGNVVLQVDDNPALYTLASGPTMTVQNDQPVLSIASGQLTYAGGSGATPFGTPGIGVSDINSSGFSPFFTGATITASITAGGVSTEDLLQVRSAGTVSVSGSTVSWNGSPIASVTGGFAGSPLVVTFTGMDVPEQGVVAVLENLSFHNIGGANPTQGVRTVTLGFNDGSSTAPGGARAATVVTRTVQVVVGNALPVIEANAELSVVRSSTTVIGNSTLRVTDEESAASAVVFTVVDFPDEGDLLLGSGPGAVRLAAGGTETFTQADVDAGLLSYEHQGSSLPGDTFTFIVSDGSNQLPVTTFTITVPGADANPVLFLPLSTLTYTEGAAESVVFPAAPFASGTLISDANTFEFSNGSLLIEIVTEAGVADAHPGDRLGVRSQSIPGLPQYDEWNYYYTPEIDYSGQIAMVGTDVVRRQYSFYHYWANNYFNSYYPGQYPDPGGLPFPSPSPPTSYPNSWYFGHPVPIDVRMATLDATDIGVGGPLRFSLLSGVGAGFGDPIVSAQAVAHLIDNLTFANVSDDPPERDRWLRITLAEAAPSTAVGVASIKLKITPVNDGPVFEIPVPPPAPVEVIDALAGVTLRVRVLAADPDLPSTSSLTYSLIEVDPPSAGVATINATSGALDFTPLSTFVAPVTLSVRATDNLGASTDADVAVNVLAGPTALGPLVVSDPPFEGFEGEALSYVMVIRPDPALPAPGAGTVSVTLVGDVPSGAVLSAGSDQLRPVLDVPSLVRPPDGVYTFGIRVEIDYGGTLRVGYQPVTFKVRASGAPN
jgi:hypothetical protein